MTTIPLAKPDIGKLEKRLVAEVMDSGILSRGPMLESFEQAFSALTESNHAVGVSSGTSALILALRALDVGNDDEVITVSYSVPATLNAILAVGAMPVLLDVDLTTRGMDVKQLRQTINKDTKAVILVHAFGQSAFVDEILKICDANNVPLIEDACEAPFNRFKGKMLGSWGKFGAFGFYGNKQITTGEGGMLVTQDEELADKVRCLRNNGRNMDGRHFDQDGFGVNSRLNELSAALGVAQTMRINEIRERKQYIATRYQEELSTRVSLSLPKFHESEHNSMWFAYVVHLKPELSNRRDTLCENLANDGISTGKYFAPLHLQPFYQNNFNSVKLPRTELLSRTGIALPYFNGLKDEDISFVASKLKFYLDQIE